MWTDAGKKKGVFRQKREGGLGDESGFSDEIINQRTSACFLIRCGRKLLAHIQTTGRERENGDGGANKNVGRKVEPCLSAPRNLRGVRSYHLRLDSSCAPAPVDGKRSFFRMASRPFFAHFLPISLAPP